MNDETAFYTTVCAQSDEATWKAARWEGITASQVGTVLGLIDPKYETRSYDQIVSDYANKVETFKDNPFARAGRYFESSILKWASDMNILPSEAISCGKLLRSKAWPWLLATPDAYCKTNRNGKEELYVIECKHHTPYSKSKWIHAPPESYVAQLYTQMAVTGIRSGCILQQYMGIDPKPWHYDWDDKIISMIVKKTKEFWEEVEDKRKGSK